MLERILTDDFRGKLKLTFRDIENQQDRSDEKEFAKDEVRIREELLDTVTPHASDVILDEDYLIAAVDGSGSGDLMTLDDVRVHLLSTSTVVLDTNTRAGDPFRPLDRATLENAFGRAQPFLDCHWHSGVRGDARTKMADSLAEIYPLKDSDALVLPFFRDIMKRQLKSMSDLSGTNYGAYTSSLGTMEALITREQMLTNPAVHDELRTASEYAAARIVLTSSIQPKYLLLDGAMSIFMHQARQYPSMPSGFMLRELCSLAREKHVVLCAVSKNHTIPFAHRIARMAQEAFGEGSKWFCLLPGSEDPGGGLYIYQDRTYIPPRLAVPYLFSFSMDNRPSRIDFDRIWWLENVFVQDDPSKTRENEKALFQEIEFMSRDARWYGYPVALALAHEECKLSYEDLRLAREVAGDVRHELGLDPRRTTPYREDFNL